MPNYEVRIVRLEPFELASVRAIGENPEQEAWSVMEAWAERQGLLDDPQKHPIYGFNNPNPSPGAKEYGYEFWIRIDPGIQIGEGMERKRFEGGLYAVTACNLSEDIHSEFFRQEGYLESWKNLHEWVEASEYRPAGHQSLEKALDPRVPEEELVLELHYPIEA